jgi:hypothetical protein
VNSRRVPVALWSYGGTLASGRRFLFLDADGLRMVGTPQEQRQQLRSGMRREEVVHGESLRRANVRRVVAYGDGTFDLVTERGAVNLDPGAWQDPHGVDAHVRETFADRVQELPGSNPDGFDPRRVKYVRRSRRVILRATGAVLLAFLAFIAVMAMTGNLGPGGWVWAFLALFLVVALVAQWLTLRDIGRVRAWDANRNVDGRQPQDA